MVAASTAQPASLDKVQAIFLEGLERVARVIDGTPDYDAIIGHKYDDSYRNKYSPSVSIKEKREMALKDWRRFIETSKKASYAFPDVDFLFLGRTQNNIREFSFFLNALKRLDRKFTHFNAVDLNLLNRQHSQDDLDCLIAHLLPVMTRYVEGRETLGPDIVYQLGQLAVHFARYYFSLTRTDGKRPLLAVVANDHSPNPVAFSLAMKAFNIKRLYIQHAEVSPSFPPLDFEYNILRNAVSRRIYEEIAPVEHDIFVISRLPAPFKRPRNLTEEVSNQSVVLYTTGRVELNGLIRVLERLNSNPDISSIHIKPHPNQAKVEWPDYVSIVETVPDFPHIAVVANSSVVVELLHNGIPVFQNFDFDPVEPDYYGFVRNKVAGAGPLESLDGPFWKSFAFNDRWHCRFADLYAPPEECSERDKKILCTRIEALLSTRVRPRTGVKLQETPKTPVKRPKSKLRPFQKALVERMSKYSPRLVLETVKYVAYESTLKNREAMQNLRVADAHLVRSGSSAVVSPERLKWLGYSLATVAHPTEWLHHALSVEIISYEEAIRAIDDLYVKRNPVVFRLFDTVELLEDHLPVYLWISFKRFEITGVSLPYPLDGMLEALFEIQQMRFVRASLEGLAFNACLRENRLDLLNLLFEKAARVKRETLSTTRRIALLRHLIQSGKTFEYDSMRDEFWRAETPFHRLKITDVDNVFGTKHSGSSHREIESAFETTAPAAIAAEFKADIKPVYSRIRTNMNFMDVRSNVEERNHFRSLIVHNLLNKKPLSMIRLSDGEGYAFADNHEFFTLEDQLNRERHWWGIELDSTRRSEIVSRIRSAVSQADILGIPSIHRFVRDVHEKSSSFKTSVQGRGLLQVLHHFTREHHSAHFGDEKMNIPLFRELELVREILSASERCVLVSSAKADHLPEWMLSLTSVCHITIPTHFRTSQNDKYHISDQPLPLIYETIDAEVRSKTSPGTLVLVAGGIAGKIFIGTARDAGGVALDLGSVMDEWLDAGIHALH